MHFRFNGVSERDMDILFLEEFAVIGIFCSSFYGKLKMLIFQVMRSFQRKCPSLIRIWVNPT